jgi:hypothetical protein
MVEGRADDSDAADQSARVLRYLAGPLVPEAFKQRARRNLQRVHRTTRERGKSISRRNTMSTLHPDHAAALHRVVADLNPNAALLALALVSWDRGLSDAERDHVTTLLAPLIPAVCADTGTRLDALALLWGHYGDDHDATPLRATRAWTTLAALGASADVREAMRVLVGVRAARCVARESAVDRALSWLARAWPRVAAVIQTRRGTLQLDTSERGAMSPMSRSFRNFKT